MPGIEPITAISNAIGGLTTAINTYISKVPTIVNLRRLKKLEKVSDIAEKIIFMADATELKTNKEYKKLRKDFFKNN